MLKSVFGAVAFAVVAGVGIASPSAAQQGPVGKACGEEIQKLCADKEHGQGQVRACLEANKDKVGAACKEALDTTGPGKGMGKGQGKGAAE